MKYILKNRKMEEWKKNFWICVSIVGLIFILMIIGGFYYFNKSLGKYYTSCESVGIIKKECGVTMTVQCLNDCRKLGYKEFRWNDQGFGGDTCWCLDKENKSVQVW